LQAASVPPILIPATITGTASGISIRSSVCHADIPMPRAASINAGATCTGCRPRAFRKSVSVKSRVEQLMSQHRPTVTESFTMVVMDS
jgi:hypothetical protein